MYRRANAFERSGKVNEAISDAQRLISVSPKGGSGDEQTNILLRKLRETAQSKVYIKKANWFYSIPCLSFFLKHTQQTQLTSQIQQMFEAINTKSNQETVRVCVEDIYSNNILVLFKALNNLLVISREDAGAEGILAFDRDLRQIMDFIQKNERLTILGTIRVLASIARNSYKRVKV